MVWAGLRKQRYNDHTKHLHKDGSFLLFHCSIAPWHLHTYLSMLLSSQISGTNNKVIKYVLLYESRNVVVVHTLLLETDRPWSQGYKILWQLLNGQGPIPGFMMGGNTGQTSTFCNKHKINHQLTLHNFGILSTFNILSERNKASHFYLTSIKNIIFGKHFSKYLTSQLVELSQILSQNINVLTTIFRISF